MQWEPSSQSAQSVLAGQNPIARVQQTFPSVFSLAYFPPRIPVATCAAFSVAGISCSCWTVLVEDRPFDIYHEWLIVSITNATKPLLNL
jgi:hypothetical protein